MTRGILMGRASIGMRGPSVSEGAVNADWSIAALRGVAWVQGLYYLVTGLWPLLSIGTFQLVTGPKRDLWLVKTAGLLITVIGGVLTLAGGRKRMFPEAPVLAAGSALGLAGIGVLYYRRRVLRHS